MDLSEVCIKNYSNGVFLYGNELSQPLYSILIRSWLSITDTEIIMNQLQFPYDLDVRKIKIVGMKLNFYDYFITLIKKVLYNLPITIEEIIITVTTSIVKECDNKLITQVGGPELIETIMYFKEIINSVKIPFGCGVKLMIHNDYSKREGADLIPLKKDMTTVFDLVDGDRDDYERLIDTQFR